MCGLDDNMRGTGMATYGMDMSPWMAEAEMQKQSGKGKSGQPVGEISTTKLRLLEDRDLWRHKEQVMNRDHDAPILFRTKAN